MILQSKSAQVSSSVLTPLYLDLVPPPQELEHGLHGLQQLNSDESSPNSVLVGSVKDGSVKVGSVKVGSVKAGSVKVGSVNVGSVKVVVAIFVVVVVAI